MERAYSLLTVKAVDDDQRIIDGIASTPSTDRMGDVVEPQGVQFKLPLPLLWQHDSRQPIGHVIEAKVTDEGIRIKAQIAKGVLRRIDEAWALIKAGLVRGLSIGFSAIETARIEGSFGYRFLKWEWLELSAVTIPANQDATITAVKSIDRALLAAFGTGGDADDPLPGVSGHSATPTTKGRFYLHPQKGQGMKTIQEQIAALEAARVAKTARMSEIMQKSIDEGRSTDEQEREEFDTLQAEVKTADADLTRLRELERLNVAAAKPVEPKGVVDAATASVVRGTGPIQVRSNLPKGTAFTRYAIALARSKGNIMHAVEIAKQWRDSTPEVEQVLKAAVDAGTTTDSTWAAPLVSQEQMASEFIELLRPATIIGRIGGFRRVPFNVKMPRQTTGGSASWVGQGKAKPVSELAFDTVTLGFSKVAGIVVLTEELVRFSNPSAEAVVRDDMIATIAQFLDQQFIDPSVAAVSNVSPASVTNGVSAVASTGATLAQVEADVKSLFSNLIAANIDLSTGTWVMHPRTALSLSLLRTTQEIVAYPQITPQGGSWFGLPVVTSANVPVGVTTGEPTTITLVNAGDVLLADDGGVTLDASREASLQMDSAPTSAATSMISLWQQNMIGLRAERYINWLKRRSAAVQYISGVTY